jgi:hypothetical protein
MLGQYSYHEIFKKTIIGFGTLFNNIQLRRVSNDKTEVMKVPLAYGPAEKFLARLRQTPDPQNAKVQITLPRISFEMDTIQYDSDRKVAPTQSIKFKNAGANDGMSTAYMPVPYNLGFTLSVISKNQDDALQIVEQILPYFQPSYNFTVDLVPQIGEVKDIIVNMDSVSFEDDYDGEFDQRRALIYTFKFTAKTYLYGPVREPSVIRKAQVDTYTSMDTVNAPREVRYTVTPDPLNAEADDDFGFSEVFSEFTDMQKWNPDTGADEPL